MRSLSETRTLWITFKRHASLDELREVVRVRENGDPTGVKLRSAYWKALLLFETLDTSSWQMTLASSRSAYESLRSRFLGSAEDEALREEIQQDVERCMPGMPFFQDASTQKILFNVLFVFCKLNPDLSYRQGMHELLAPMIWIVDQDSINVGNHSKALGDDALLTALFDPEHVEHDAFALFGQVMQNAKKFYEQSTHSANENPLVARSQRIAGFLLSQIDPELSQHLDNIGIVPQIFLIRWIRLLYGREFEFADVLTVWDVVFAEDPSLEIVDYISLTMLLRIRWELLDSTYNEALSILLHYPPTDHDITAQMLTIDALLLRSSMTSATANRLVTRYTGRAMLGLNRPSTPPALQRNITSFSGMDAFRRSFRGRPGDGSPQINFEAMLQSTVQNIYSRGEQLGIGKAVRSAIDEVHRKAQDIRENNGIGSPSGLRQRPRSSHTLAAKLRALEDRNSQLAQLLDNAVTQLWDLQKLVAETQADEKTTGGLDLEKFSVAVGQVQYVQVYLQDSSLPLAPDAVDGEDQDTTSQDITSQEVPSVESDSQMQPPDREKHDSELATSRIEEKPEPKTPPRAGSIAGLVDPSAFDEEPEAEVLKPAVEQAVSTEPMPAVKAHTPSRPPLTETKFSWMLGQPKEDAFSNLGTSRTVSASTFGPDELPVVHKTRKGIRPKKKYATPAVSTDVNLDFES